MGLLGEAIAANGRLMLGLAAALVKDVRPETFARFPTSAEGAAVRTNHPAFVYGHLALYPARFMLATGLEPNPLTAPDRFTELFKAGVECQDDPAGTIYPAMDEVVGVFRDRYEKAIEIFAGIKDDVLSGPAAIEGFWRDRFPHVGAAVLFGMAGHTMVHLGQVSAWRRCMGLPPAV